MTCTFYIKKKTQFASISSGNFCHLFWGHFCATFTLLRHYFEKLDKSNSYHNIFNKNIQLIFEWKPKGYLILENFYKIFYKNKIIWSPDNNNIINTAIKLDFDDNKYEYTRGLIRGYKFLQYTNSGSEILRKRYQKNNDKCLVYNTRSKGRRVLNDSGIINILKKFCNEKKYIFKHIDTGRLSYEEQLSIMSNADIYLYYHGAAGVFKSLVRDDALIIEFQPGNSWHTGFILVENYQRSTHILTTTSQLKSDVGSLPKLKPEINYSNTIPLFELSNSENIWANNRGKSRNINFDRILQILNYATNNNELSKRLNIIEYSNSVHWLKDIYNGRGIHCIEED